MLAGGLTIAAFVGLVGCSAEREEEAAVETFDRAEWEAGVDQWHARRIERLRAPDGWLSLVALEWIEEGENRIGSAIDAAVHLPEPAPPELGVMTLAGGVVTLVPAAGIAVSVDGVPLTGPTELGTDADDLPTVLEIGSLRATVLERSGRFALRVKDTKAPLIASFEGIERFPLDPAWRIVARFEPHPSPKVLEVPTVLGTVEETPSPGVVVFEHDGQTYRLDAQPGGDDGSLFLVFGDATNGKSTYGGGRFVYSEPPADGRVVVDFNRSYNPPCIFTPYATCPLPLPEAKFRFPIEAGEKTWGSAEH